MQFGNRTQTFEWYPIFNDLERPLTQISRSCHYLMLNIAEAVTDITSSSENQFGFKKSLSCNHAIFTTRKIVDSFIRGVNAPLQHSVGIQSLYTYTGRQRSQNFGRNRLSGGEMGAQKCPRHLGYFCQQYEMTFRQLRNGCFSPNLAMESELWLKRRFWAKTYEKFLFRSHLPPKPQTLRGQTGTSLREGYRSRDAPQRDTVYSTL